MNLQVKNFDWGRAVQNVSLRRLCTFMSQCIYVPGLPQGLNKDLESKEAGKDRAEHEIRFQHKKSKNRTFKLLNAGKFS